MAVKVESQGEFRRTTQRLSLLKLPCIKNSEKLARAVGCGIITQRLPNAKVEYSVAEAVLNKDLSDVWVHVPPGGSNMSTLM